MSDKVYVPNTFPTPNDLIDKVMPVVSEPAFKVVMLITRHTLGWGGHNAHMAWQIGIGGLCRLTGLSHQGVINGVRELLKLGLILIKKSPRNSRTPNQYALNLDLTTGELVKNLDQSTSLSSPTSQRFRPVLVNKVDSLKINLIKHNKSGANAPSPPSVVNSPKKKSKPAAAVPSDLRLAASKIIGRVNELAGTAYEIDSKIVQKGLVARLTAGKSESDCLAVVEHKWREWENNPDMRQYFNPETLFRETNFDKYLNAARMDSASKSRNDTEWRRKTFING